MSINTVKAKLVSDWLSDGQVILIDVREPSEHASESIANAVSLPLSQVSKDNLLNACKGNMSTKKIVVYCRSGKRSANATEKLQSEDSSLELYNLEGGILAWKDAGLPVVSDDNIKVLPLDRQVQLAIGILVLVTSFLGWVVSGVFLLLTMFIGAGLIFAGLTGTCGLAMVLAKMPWNQKGCSVGSKKSCC
jgi:rhodanese-related sulfurtransferase